MKSTKKTLSLHRETIRTLSDDQLARADGAWGTVVVVGMNTVNMCTLKPTEVYPCTLIICITPGTMQVSVQNCVNRG